MRRRMNLAGLLQYLLMLLLAGSLVLLVMVGASPEVFALALLVGALLAALPAIYIGAILLPRQRRATQRVRQDGLPACAEVHGRWRADRFRFHPPRRRIQTLAVPN